MNISKQELTHRLQTMISNTDIKDYLGDERIITYRDLDNYNSILELLPMEKDYVIFLVEQQINQGHWICLTRNGKTITYFDSYGVRPDGQIDKNTCKMREELDQKPNELTRLLNTAPSNFKVIYNKMRLQVNDSNYEVNTCGRYVLFVVLTNQILNWSLAKIQKYFKDKSEKTGLPTDLLVCELIE